MVGVSNSPKSYKQSAAISLPDYDELMSFIVPLVEEQGRFLIERWGKEAVVDYKDARDLVTEADRVVEQNLKKALLEKFPGTGFVGEESDSVAPQAEYVWHVDPIDGSKYFATGSPLFATTVALVKGDEPQLGVIHFPAAAQTFWAYQGSGVYLNGQRVPKPEKRGRLAEAIVLVDVTGDKEMPEAEKKWIAGAVRVLMLDVYRLRMYGLAASAARLATGTFDAWVELGDRGSKQMEFMAAKVIAQEAGFAAEEIDVGFPIKRWVIGSGELLAEIKQLLC